MDIIVIALVAFGASVLTFFSGFGLGTLLFPAMMLFFPVMESMFLTAVVHFLNNIFKIALVRKHVNIPIALKFGLPAMLGSFFGSYALIYTVPPDPIFIYHLGSHECVVDSVKILIGLLLVFFAMFEILPRLKNLKFEQSRIVEGGLVSGLFGGLTGHQGALRSAFLVKFDLSKEVFIATGIAIAFAVDITRIPMYFQSVGDSVINDNSVLLSVTVLAAFSGAFLGNRMLKKVTIEAVKNIIAIFILSIAIAMIAGVL
jgi:uncharacterized protein